MLMKKSTSSRIKSLEDLVSDDDVTLIVVKSTSEETTLRVC